MKLLLASRSAARRAMLKAAGVSFEAVDAEFDEEAAKAELKGTGAAELAEALADRKALAVTAGAVDLVLGSDQTLEAPDGAIFGKPQSRDDAATQLRTLSGRTHKLHSAASIAEGGRIVWRSRQTVALTVRPLSEAFIGTYLADEYQAIRWGVGGYRIEGRGAQLFERIEGSHFAILGLPLLPLLVYLRERHLLAS